MLIRAKLTPTTNGNGSALPIYKHVPPDLKDDICQILETEGMMETSAENRILTRLDGNHRETISRIDELKDTLHQHDKRLTVVEKDVQEFKDAAKIAGEERRNNGRLIKGTFVSALASIILAPLTGGLVGFYVLRQTPPVQEAVKADAAISSKLDRLTDLMIEEREARKVNQSEPAATPKQTGSRTQKHGGRNPEPVQGPGGPGAALRPGEMITTRDHEPPVISFNQIPILEMKVPK